MSIQISITGDLGSGKSTLASCLSDKFNLAMLKAGDIGRNLAAANGINILQINKSADRSEEMDDIIDAAVPLKIAELEERNQDFILDARVGFYYAPDTLKIKLIAQPEVTAERVFNAKRKNEIYDSIEDARNNLALRHNFENARFIKRYGVNIDDLSKFDLIIDTSFIEKGRAAEIVEMVIGAREAGRPFPKFWCHPAQIIPGGQSARDFKTDFAKELIEDMEQGRFDYLECCRDHLSVMSVERTTEGDLLLRDGHHRIVAAHVASLPYIGMDLMPNPASFEANILSNMNFNFDAMDFLAKRFAKAHPDKIPAWGCFNERGIDFTALDKYKPGFLNRVNAWRASFTQSAQPAI